MPHFIVLCLLRFTDVAFFFTNETSKTITVRFIVILALLRWSGTKPAIYPRYVCSTTHLTCVMIYVRQLPNTEQPILFIPGTQSW